MTKNNEVYGFSNSIQNLPSAPFIRGQNPTTSDLGFEIAQIWINSSSGQVFIFSRVAQGNAIWIELGQPEILQEGRVTLALGTITVSVPGIKADDKVIFSRTSVGASTGLGELIGFIPSGTETVTFTSVGYINPSTTIDVDLSIIDYIVYIT